MLLTLLVKFEFLFHLSNTLVLYYTQYKTHIRGTELKGFVFDFYFLESISKLGFNYFVLQFNFEAFKFAFIQISHKIPFLLALRICR